MTGKVTVSIGVGALMSAWAGWQVAGWHGLSIAVAVWFAVSFTALGFIEALTPEAPK